MMRVGAALYDVWMYGCMIAVGGRAFPIPPIYSPPVLKTRSKQQCRRTWGHGKRA
jgi:hypothetical protein